MGTKLGGKRSGIETSSTSEHFVAAVAAQQAEKKRAGRPAQLSEPTRKQIYMDDISIRTALGLGKGNLSAGVREALRRAAAAEDS